MPEVQKPNRFSNFSLSSPSPLSSSVLVVWLFCISWDRLEMFEGCGSGVQLSTDSGEREDGWSLRITTPRSRVELIQLNWDPVRSSHSFLYNRETLCRAKLTYILYYYYYSGIFRTFLTYVLAIATFVSISMTQFLISWFFFLMIKTYSEWIYY